MPRRSVSRWDTQPSALNMQTCVPQITSPEHMEGYMTIFRIHEITHLLEQQGDPLPTRRSPSPDPEYNVSGHRTNTRAQRHRKRLQDEQHQPIEQATHNIPGFKAPTDYRPRTVVYEKVLVPAQDHPNINFIGRLLGPRGATLKVMATKSQAKIQIRGKGSVKDGRRDDSLHEPLHCLVSADSHQKTDAAKRMIQKAIRQAIDGDDESKVNQLRDLAIMNGTFRDDERQPARQPVTSRVLPSLSHAIPTTNNADAAFDQEYRNLLSDINDEHSSLKRDTVPPWRRDRANQQAKHSH